MSPLVGEDSIEGQPLESVNVYKDLGLFTPSNLSWNQHVDKITAKASRVLGLVKRTCRDLKDIGDLTNQNATQPETSQEVICSQSASL